MLLWTYSDALAKIKRDMDLEQETFVSPSEIMGYFNEAIDEAEGEVHGLFQDYFKKPYPVPLVTGTSRYNLPSDIYANKIRFIQYNENDTTKYKVNRIKVHEIADVDDEDDYMFDLEFVDASTGVQMVLYPASRITSSTAMRLYYLRNANRITQDSDKIDIPEAINFIFAFVKMRIGEKELSPLLQSFISNLEQQRVNLRAALKDMIPDDYETFEQDLSIYEEHS